MNGDWMGRGRCAEVDPELFFPEKGGSIDRPKSICARCEVRAECLAWALAQPGDVDGIWGGTSVNERRLMRRVGLTARQERIEAIASLRFAADGEWVPTAGVVTARQAAEMLGVSERTIERYKRDLRRSA